MNKNNLTISVGIPAYNEEANIKPLLKSLLEQNISNFNLQEIIVVSDKSQDETVEKALEIKDKRIKVIKNPQRLGQAKSQNKILKMFSGDILVLLNADVLPADKNLLKNIIEPFNKHDKIGLVGGKVVPLKAQNFIESAINYSVLTKQAVYEQINNGSNVYLCHGRVRAFSKVFAKKFSWEEVVAEDAFSYFACLESKYKFYYKSDAIVNYRSPQTLSDHLKQSTRFYQNRHDLEKYFKKDQVTQGFKIPKSALISVSLKYFTNSPIKSIMYIIILILAKLKTLVQKNTNVKWEASISSKELMK